MWNRTSNSPVPWGTVDSAEELEQLLQTPQPTVIYKHSPTCGISAMAREQLESSWQAEHVAQAQVVLVDVLAQRPLSLQVATLTGVTHQSPQLIVWKDGQVAYQASHYKISYQDMVQAL